VFSSQDLSTYTQIKVKVSSSNRSKLRLKVVGNEVAVRDAGCYPVATIEGVTPTLSEKTLELSSFASLGFCAANARTMAQTLSGVTRVEVEDNFDLTAPSAASTAALTTFAVGDITFAK
jgi:hypothetical protein